MSSRIKKRVFVTGASGFVGTSLIQVAADEVPGVEADRLEIHPAPIDLDLRDPDSVMRAVRHARPDAVIHLAARAAVAESFSDPYGTYAVNFLGTLNLLSALRATGFSGRFLYVSSGDVYGAVPSDKLPIREELPLAPRSPYAVSKAAAELLCGQWERSHDFDIVICRPFNHIGPGQDRRFAISEFAAQLVAIKRLGAAPILEVGNIDVTRDFLDVRDVVRAYFLLLDHGKRGVVYNVCSGKEQSLRTMIELLSQRLGLNVEIRIDPTRVRAHEQLRVAGSPDRLVADTGWAPRENLQNTLDRIIGYWEMKTT